MIVEQVFQEQDQPGKTSVTAFKGDRAIEPSPKKTTDASIDWIHRSTMDMRKPRKLRADARYHVTIRITRKEMVFQVNSTTELFLSTVKRAKKKYAFSIENFCIMGNHVHFIIKPREGMSLSRIMQWIMSVFAQRYNKIHDYWGPVWGSRFFSRILESFRDFIATFKYIHYNPVAAKLVDNPIDWPSCGLRHARDGCGDIMEVLDQWILLLFPEYQPLRLT